MEQYAITASYLLENGYIQDVQIVDDENGTPFAIFDSWDEVNEVNYAVIEKLVPEALPLYEEAGLIKEPRWHGQAKMITEIKIDGKVPQIVLDAFEQTEIKWYDIVESALGCEWGFSDEYTTCSDCGNVIKTSPNSYSWQPDFYVGDGFIVCNRCFNDNEDYQEAYIEERINDPKQAVNGLLTEEQIEDLGFVKFNANESYENGWYEGQTDDPQDIYDALSEKFEEVLFVVDGVGQFDVHFDVFVRNEIERDDD